MTNTAEKIVARAEFLDRLFKRLSDVEFLGAQDPPMEMEKGIEFCAEVFADLARTKKELGASAAIERVRRVGVLEAEMRAMREKIEKLEHPDDDTEATT